jgi:hypothetical protein
LVRFPCQRIHPVKAKSRKIHRKTIHRPVEGWSESYDAADVAYLLVVGSTVAGSLFVCLRGDAT